MRLREGLPMPARHRILIAAAMILAAACQVPGVASAEPDPVVEPPILPTPDPFAITSEQTQDNPGGTLVDLLTGDAGGNPADVLNQAVGLSAPPPDNPLLATPLLQPQNFRMPSAEQGSPYPLAPNVNPSPFARIDAWKGVHALLHGGLGRMPGTDLGEPLPGTAAAPGSNLPPGLEQFYLDPAALPAPQPQPVG